MRLWRLMAVLAVVTSLLVVVASPALAQPANDTIEGAELVGEFPFLDELDTTTATTDATDAALNEECGAPATDASGLQEPQI